MLRILRDDLRERLSPLLPTRKPLGILESARRRRARIHLFESMVVAIPGAALGVAGAIWQEWATAAVPLAGLVGAGVALGVPAMQGPETEVPAAMRRYADRNQLTAKLGSLPEVTPLLLHAWSRTKGQVIGAHPSGFHGSVGVFTFVRPYRVAINAWMRLITYFWWPESKGLQMLVALAELPESKRTLPILLCERRYGGALLDSTEEAVRKLKRVHLESVELDRQQEVFVHPRQEPVWVRRLFSPSLVVWMTDESTHEISFEIFDGYLCVASPLRKGSKITEPEVERISMLAHALTERVKSELADTQLSRPPALIKARPL